MGKDFANRATAAKHNPKMGARGPQPGFKEKLKAHFTDGVPPPPDWLDAAAVEEYLRVSEELEKQPGHLQMVDMAVLAQYAQSYSDTVRLTAEIRIFGEFAYSPKTWTEYAHPRVGMLSMARKALLECATKLGFSPTSRSQLGPREKKAANPLNAILGPGN